ncbi:hypothetical protein EC968_001049 [Mortierella alpina]|nr:hypothetical protein EC968_001049 [Mortierella alpina]
MNVVEVHDVNVNEVAQRVAEANAGEVAVVAQRDVEVGGGNSGSVAQKSDENKQAEEDLREQRGPATLVSRSVLIVTPSKAELQRRMLQERNLCSHGHDLGQSQPTESQMDDLLASAVDPWRHLFPVESTLGAQDEFCSVTQTQTQTQTPAQTQAQTQTREVNSSGQLHKIVDNTVHVRAENTQSEEVSFQPELWARIQMRYAPTIPHLQSLFRCLHVDAEATRGRTFGQDMEDSTAGLEPSRIPVPSLVLLIGCFETEDVTNLLSRPTLHGDQERVDHIKAISKAMSEIKDSLEWIHRQSGRQPELVLFEETGPDSHALPNQSYNDAHVHAIGQVLEKLGPSMPSPQELWLQKLLGYWVDAMITVERDDGESQEQHDVEVALEGYPMEASQRENWKSVVSKDLHRLWIRTHQSIMAMVSSSANNTAEGDTGRTTTSSGAVLGLRWHFDSVDNRFHLHLLT